MKIVDFLLHICQSRLKQHLTTLIAMSAKMCVWCWLLTKDPVLHQTLLTIIYCAHCSVCRV